ncbi:MAG: hypothetical protein K1X83_05235 [Oligoflexia bacterium]|nr:hypothetical protein [Oligoflexia bacterium]
MELDPNELKAGMKWLWGAGLAAVLLSVALFCADEALTNSKRDQILGQTLNELRTAQTSIVSDTTDPRQSELPSSTK